MKPEAKSHIVVLLLVLASSAIGLMIGRRSSDAKYSLDSTTVYRDNKASHPMVGVALTDFPLSSQVFVRLPVGLRRWVP